MKKIINTNIGLVIICLFSVVCVMADFIVIDNVLNKYIEYCDEKNEDAVDSRSGLKINSNNDWVYDAMYENNISTISYSTGFNTYYLDDIVVPFININSSYADIVNEKIRNIYEDAISIYTLGLEDGMSYVEVCDYEYYINDNILSVVLTYGHGATDVVDPMYYMFNFNLTNGEMVSFVDAYSYLGFIDDEVKNLAREILNKYFDNHDTVFSENFPRQTFYSNSLALLFDIFLNDNYVQFYIDSNQNLNIFTMVWLPSGRGTFNEIFTLVK